MGYLLGFSGFEGAGESKKQPPKSASGEQGTHALKGEFSFQEMV